LYVAHLTLVDFRSYATAEVPLEPGATAFIGRNGQGKTNLVEAIDYLSRLSSHRVAADAPLVRAGAERALVRAAVVRDGRQALLEVEINPGRSNRARVNRADLPRARELVGLMRTVVFAPDDLALVKGDPSGRRAFLDDLLVLRAPRLAGVRQDYERVLKQRNSLLKTAGAARRGGSSSRAESALSTLGVWDSHLARTGAELLAARIALVEDLRPPAGEAYANVARGATRDDLTMSYKPSFELPEHDPRSPDRAELAQALLAEVERRRGDEIDRGISLVGPHRDDLTLMLRPLPVKGYASHGESWSCALALRLASYDLLRAGGDDPILILDDVFAELDTERRERLAELVADAEQVLVTAAVPDDVPVALKGQRIDVVDGTVRLHV
jgi:DNA replication and repair protein RecF